MNTKLITALIVILLVWLGYRTFVYYGQVQEESRRTALQATGRNVSSDELPGMPYQLQASLDAAMREGPTALKKWLDTYGPSIRDPRKAWIELDYCTMVARDNPREAQAVFAAVKKRTRSDSPVYPRIKQLENTFE